MRILALFIPLLLLSAFSCMEDSAPIPPVEVQFQLLNADGEATTSFQEGEDIVFDYRIINKTDEKITWYGHNEGGHPVYPVFFVYGILPPSVELPAGGEVEIGATHIPQIFYTRMGNPLGPKEEITIKVTWKGDLERTKVTWGSIKYPENKNLPKGNYIVEFEHAISFYQYDDLHVYTKVAFEVL